MGAPQIKVGIMADKEISFTLQGNYHLEFSRGKITGRCKVRKSGAGVELTTNNNGWHCPNGLKLIPFNPEKAEFTLYDVTIGINFHWERKEDQSFKGGLNFMNDGEKIQAINELSVEDYLISVISS